MSRAIVFVNAWVGAGNLGDEMLFDRLLARLRALGVKQVTTVSGNPAQTEERFSVRALSHRDVVGAFKAIRRSHLFIMGPGGILQDDTSPWSLPYHLHRAALARRAGVPVIGMGLGAGPIRRATSGPLLRRALGGAGPLAVRDSESAELLLALGVRNVVVTADLVVSSPSPDIRPANRIVVCLRPHKRGGGLVPVSMQRDVYEDDYLGQMASALDDVARVLDTECRFLAFEATRDHPLHERVAARMKTPTSLGIPDLGTVLEEVGRSRGVIAMRFHSAIAALITTRPTVMIGYAPKVTSLAKRLGDGFAYIPNEAAHFGGLPERLVEVIGTNARMRTERLTELREIESQNETLLREALSSDGHP